MSSAVIRSLLETAVANMSSPISIAPENVEFNPAPDVPYMALTLLLATPENPTLEPGFHRENGIFQISLKYPRGGGSGLCQSKAEAVRAVFPRGRSLTSGQITVTVSGTPEIAPGRTDGDRYVVPVKVRFFANVFE